MSDELLDAAEDCQRYLRGSLEGAQVSVLDPIEGAHAAALLSRMVFLCESAVEVAQTEHRAAAAVILRSAIECWIDCCYLLYCKAEAVLQFTALDLNARKKLSRTWLGEPAKDVADQLADLNRAVELGREAGSLSTDFQLRERMPIKDRLSEAIKCRGTTPAYMNVYEYLYRGTSTTDAHSLMALEFHGEISEDVVTIHVIQAESFNMPDLVGLTTFLALGAALDVFERLGLDPSGLTEHQTRLGGLIEDRAVELTREASEGSNPEVQKALDLITVRAEQKLDGDKSP